MRTARYMVFIIFAGISCLGVFLSISGCVDSSTYSGTNLSTVPPVANGHVYLDGKVVSGAIVEALAINGTDRRSTTTDDRGAFVLNLTPYTRYNITAAYRGLRHTVRPVYLPGETNTYDISLTTMPCSTIEGSGYTIISIGPFENKEGRYKIYNHTRWSGFLMEARSTKDNTTLTAVTDNNGNYSIEVEPDVAYEMTGYFTRQKSYPMASFHYRNMGGLAVGYDSCITVGPNETAIVDYIIPMP